MRNKLIGHLYRALNADPLPRLALRVQHADGCVWQIANEALTLSTESGTLLGVVSLSGITLSELAPKITALGCTVLDVNAAFSALGAESLIDGAGRQNYSNGDHLFIFDSLLWSLIAAYAKQANDLTLSGQEALKQLYLGTAEQNWLDVWGASLGVARRAGQSDSDYRAWILREITRPRANWADIETAILESTGAAVHISEPYQELFTLDRSTLSGGSRFQDGSNTTFNVIRPIARTPLNWTGPLAVINRNRPAGTLVLPPIFAPDTREVVRPASSLMSAQEAHRSLRATLDCSGILDNNLRLSGAELPVLNYPIFSSNIQWLGVWDSRTWVDALPVSPAHFATGTVLVDKAARADVFIANYLPVSCVALKITVTGHADWVAVSSNPLLNRDGIYAMDYYLPDYYSDAEVSFSLNLFDTNGVAASGTATYFFDGI